MRKALATLLVSLTLTVGPLPTIASAAPAPTPDFSIPGGHFYTEANGQPSGSGGDGFAITNAQGIPFWTFFTQNGGVDTLGYPISQRFRWDGFVCQATQRAIMQWNPASHQVQLVNIFDYLSKLGKDDWLAAAHLAPKPQRTPEESKPLSFPMLAHYRFAWLYHDPAIFHRYFSTPNYYTIYGLPTSPIVDFGPYWAERFQRVVMYHWKTTVPWADSRGVSVGLAGDLLKELGLIPAAAIQPGAAPTTDSPSQPLPAATVKTRLLSAPFHPPATDESSGPVLVGVSTWYGSSFQGQEMSDGRPYDMWNPHTAASNAYPLGTRIRVTRLTTGKSIIVEVTDHGAFSYPNVADLSYAAFSLLANPSIGVIRVRIEPASD